MFNFIHIYSFMPVRSCVGRGPSALLCTGAYNAAKTALYLFVYCQFVIVISDLLYKLRWFNV